MLDPIFYEIHTDLPRESPGRDDFTRRAFESIPPMKDPRILDIGCGPGTPTMELARLSGGEVIGLDNHQPYLDRLARKAEEAGIAGRVSAVNGSMFELPFPDAAFDLIWAEGTIYIIGFDRGLEEWRRLLKPGGHIGVQEVVWLKNDTPPDDLKAFWSEGYPAMRDVQGNLDAIAKLGYEVVDHFTPPPDVWWDEYYGPLQVRLSTLRKKYAGNAKAQSLFDDEQVEIDIFHKYSDWYGTAFFILKNP